MSIKHLKRNGFSLAYSILNGAGSILHLAGTDSRVLRHSAMARQDRDAQALRGDWQRIGGDMRAAITELRRASGLRPR